MFHCLELCLALGGALWDLVAILAVIYMPSNEATVDHLNKCMRNLAGAAGKTHARYL